MKTEIVVTTDANRAAFQHQIRKYRKLAPRIYTRDMDSPAEKIIRDNWWRIAGELFPGALLADRTALENRPTADGSIFLVTEQRTTDLALPGVTFRFRRGPAPMEGLDLPFADGGLLISSAARAFLENLSPCRQRNHDRRCLTKDEMAERLAHEMERNGKDWLLETGAAAFMISHGLGLEKEADALAAMINRTIANDQEGRSFARRGQPTAPAYDYDRLHLFSKLTDALFVHPFADRPAREGQVFFPMYEAYFTNFIEGIKFTIDEAYDILSGREGFPEWEGYEADVLRNTLAIVADDAEMSRTPSTCDELLSALHRRHARLFAGNESKSPGRFKDYANRYGGTLFVEPDLVVGTLRGGFDRLRFLPHPMARAIGMMFLVAEVHPFGDGNGRVARLMMNSELHAAGQEKIIIPSVFRPEYIKALRSMTKAGDPSPLVDVMNRAQRFVAECDFTTYEKAGWMMARCHAFADPAESGGERLLLPTEILRQRIH